MAVDEAILEATGRGEVLPTLRLYGWLPACLSIGYAQPFADVDPLRLHSYRWQVVRRPTGGRAILHTDELTYAVIGPAAEPRLAGGVLQCYQRLSQALLLALEHLGIPAQAKEKPDQPSERSPQNPICFEAPSNYEITIDGKKIIGSAQARRREGILQHGSLPLFGDLARITQGLKFPDEASRQEASRRLVTRATTVERIYGYRIDWETAAQAFVSAFQEALNITFFSDVLSEREKIRAAEIVLEKYANPQWTERV